MSTPASPPAADEEIAALRADNALLRGALEQLPCGLSVFDAQDRLVLANARYRALWSLSAEAARPGTSFQDIMAASPAEETPDSRAHTAATQGQAGARRREWLLPDGRLIEVMVTRRADGSCVALHEDITAEPAAVSQMGHLAHHDPLTGLPNRTALAAMLDRALTQPADHAELAVICIDLDRFKPVNDGLGHAAGDALLVQVAERLRQCARDGDGLVRLGGDEFALVQTGAPQPRAAAALAHRLVEAVAQPFVLDGHPVFIGCSVGIAVAPFDGDSAEALLHHADLALYRAKADGRGTWRFFEPAMLTEQTARRQLEADLREALAQGAFELAYQPQVDTDAGTVTGVEALLRWRHPRRGMVSPADFIPVAEDTGLIVPLGRWVLARACADAAAWPAGVRVAVNVSAVQFQHGGLFSDVMTALRDSGLPPQRLEVEVTETVMLHDPRHALATLNELRASGVRVAMDDFGTGYSSLSTLRSFPFDRIKIDRSFVHDAEGRPETRAIIRAVAAMGHSLGMATTVEGVESEAQLRIVRGEGCREVQGFLFSRPRPAADIPGLIAQLTRPALHGEAPA